jgi:hypothetical protein
MLTAFLKICLYYGPVVRVGKVFNRAENVWHALESEEFEDREVDGGVETEAAFVRSEGPIFFSQCY